MDSADRDRKKAWKARERENARSAFPLPNDLLESMFKAVETLVEENGCDHSHHFTTQWLSENQLPAKKVIGWLEAPAVSAIARVPPTRMTHWMQNK